MSLNQIIDQSPASALSELVVDKTLNLKAEQIKVKTNVIADAVAANTIVLNPASPYIASIPVTVQLWDGAAYRALVFDPSAPAPTIVRFRRIGDVVSCSFNGFKALSSAVTGSGKIRILFTGGSIPVQFRPFTNVYSTFVEGFNNDALTTSPMMFSFGGSASYLELSSNSAGANITTGVTGVTTLACGPSSTPNFVYYA